MIKEFNFKIEEIGLKYIGHFNICQFILISKNFSIDIPFERLSEFTQLFPEIDWEDGFFFHSLKGQYLRAVEQEGKVIGLKNIIEDIGFML